MYKIFIFDDGQWKDEGSFSDSFSNAWDYAETLKRPVKIVSAEDKWLINIHLPNPTKG